MRIAVVESIKRRGPFIKDLRALRQLVITVVALIVGVSVALLYGSESYGAETNADKTKTIKEQSQQASSKEEDSKLEIAKQWGISVEEYERYELLMKGPRGSISAPNISPIEVLGIHARTPTEQKHYAEQFAILMKEDHKRVWQFSKVYQQAFQRLFPDEPFIHTNMLEGRGKTFADKTEEGDRIMYFLRTDCKECEAVAKKLVKRVEAGKGLGLDLYFVGDNETTENDIKQWAKSAELKPEHVKKGLVTLNIGKSTMLKVSMRKDIDSTQVPLILLRKTNGDVMRNITLVDLGV